MLKKVILPPAVILLSLAGILFSFMLAEEFYFIDVTPKSGKGPALLMQISTQVCGDTNSLISCETVAKSKYSYSFGFPVAIHGIMFYAASFFFALWMFLSPSRIRAAVSCIFFWITAIGVVSDIYYIIVSIAKIKAVCTLCLFTWIINFILLGLAIIILKTHRINPFRFFSFLKTLYFSKLFSFFANFIITIMLLFFAAQMAYGTDVFLKERLKQYIEMKKEVFLSQSIATFKTEKESEIDPPPLMSVGSPDAPVTIVEFSDFLCPFCGRAARILDELYTKNPSKLRIIFVNYPLDISCNHFMRRPMHRGACDLAKGAICAAQQGKFHEYQKIVFANRLPNPNMSIVVGVASQLEISIPEFQQCLTSPETEDKLKQQINLSKSYGIRATPTIYINKKHYKGKVFPEALQKIIDMEADAATQKSD